MRKHSRNLPPYPIAGLTLTSEDLKRCIHSDLFGSCPISSLAIPTACSKVTIFT